MASKIKKQQYVNVSTPSVTRYKVSTQNIEQRTHEALKELEKAQFEYDKLYAAKSYLDKQLKTVEK